MCICIDSLGSQSWALRALCPVDAWIMFGNSWVQFYPAISELEKRYFCCFQQVDQTVTYCNHSSMVLDLVIDLVIRPRLIAGDIFVFSANRYIIFYINVRTFVKFVALIPAFLGQILGPPMVLHGSLHLLFVAGELWRFAKACDTWCRGESGWSIGRRSLKLGVNLLNKKNIIEIWMKSLSCIFMFFLYLVF